METLTIYHSETKRLKGTITQLTEPTQFGDLFESKACGFTEWHKTADDAKCEVLRVLEYFYSGSYTKDRVNDNIYSKQERVTIF